jgi:SNF2 family DNA or RNA helicase
LKFVPKPWQRPMIDHVIDSLQSNLWSPMGSGKTVCVLTAFSILKLCGSNFFPVLALAPLRVARDVWPGEGREWDHLSNLRIQPVIGDAADRRRALSLPADIYTMNYENIPWLVEELKGRWPFKAIIADESTKLKGFRLKVGTKRAASLAQIATKVERWVNLTGTPAPNGLKDLWGPNWFLDNGQRLGRTWTDFKSRWFDYDPYTRELSPKEHAAEQINNALRDITLSVDMKDYIKLEDPIVSNVYVTLPDLAMAKYRELEDEMYTALSTDVEITAVTAAARSTKCLQMAAGAVYYGEEKQWHDVHDAKITALESIIEEASGAPVLVTYWWKHDVLRILKRFPHAKVLSSKKELDAWNAGKIAVGLIHPQSAGHGLNLQHGGNIIVHYSLFWNLEYYAQVNERIGPVRQMQSGYKRPVYIYHILARDTLDDSVLERLRTKAAVQDILLAAMKRRSA